MDILVDDENEINLSTNEKSYKEEVTDDEDLEKLFMKVGGGFEEIEEENKWSHNKDLYISKLDTLIKKELGTIRTFWK